MLKRVVATYGKTLEPNHPGILFAVRNLRKPLRKVDLQLQDVLDVSCFSRKSYSPRCLETSCLYTPTGSLYHRLGQIRH